MNSQTLMVQGTMSSAGKSLLVTALCRIFARKGVKVAPFKAQNMSNNAAVCADGGEIGRAQYTQALAAGITPTVQMNPVLLKPEADSRSQVIVNGRVWETIAARNYYQRKQQLWEHVTTALDALREQHELIIIEGAGSPAELNLKRGDIVNMAVAKQVNAPVLLAGDIDRGGIFAQLLGTLMLLDDDERKLVRGLIVNKFRGDPALFYNGIDILESRGGVPVLGVVPYIHNHMIPEEDAVAVEESSSQAQDDVIDIAVIQLPRIANFDDFDPLAAEKGVSVRYVAHPDELGKPDAVIIPGTKSTIADVIWLRKQGFDSTLVALDIPIVGICGGYQMLGKYVADPNHVESDLARIDCLGLLDVETRFITEKFTKQTRVHITANTGWMAALNGQTLRGYEIHMGQTSSNSGWLSQGSSAMKGQVWGCYLHGLFENDAFRRAWLRSLGWQSIQNDLPSLDMRFDALADAVESALDMPLLEKLISGDESGR